jgi:hypothetical protein
MKHKVTIVMRIGELKRSRLLIDVFLILKMIAVLLGFRLKLLLFVPQFSIGFFFE